MTHFDVGNLLGARSPDQIAQYLTEIGDLEAALEFTQAAASGQSLSLFSKPYTQTGMVIGFIPPGGGRVCPVIGTSQVTADTRLIGKPIKITLDKFYVAEYPGNGKHSILCEFSGKNQVIGEAEPLSFALQLEARDQSAAAIAGAPIFMGLQVAADGISFKGKTINVKSSLDDAIVQALDAPAFKSGLTLLHTAQPALKPLTALSAAIVRAVVSKRKNVEVHCFDLGLDFGRGATSTRLRCGSYIVVQTDTQNWDWSQYEWNTDGTALQVKGNSGLQTDFNYMVFGVAEFSNQQP